MKVSIITATYNSASTIIDTLKSVQSQRYKNIEHIIVDGQSSDETLNIVKRNSMGTKIISEPDDGIYDAMNKGVSNASGDVIGILNSDDFFANENVVAKLINTFEKYDVDSVYGDLEYVGKLDTSKIIREWKAGTFHKSAFLKGWMPPHPSFYVRKEIYDRYGIFNTKLKSSADYELMLRFLYKHAISTKYIPEVLVKMRAGGQSNASLINRFKANREDRLAWKMNDLRPNPFTLWLKPLRKIGQYLTV